MKDKKILFIDVETGGLDPKECALTQISGIWCINGEPKETFDIKIRPPKNLRLDEGALAIQGLKIEDFEKEEYMTEQNAYKKFLEMLLLYSTDNKSKIFIGGYNVKFDIEFLSQFMIRNKDWRLFKTIHSVYIDPMGIIANLQLTGKLPVLVNNKLETWSNYFNIPIKAHNSYSDITATYKLWRVLLTMLIDHPSVNNYNLLKDDENNHNRISRNIISMYDNLPEKNKKLILDNIYNTKDNQILDINLLSKQEKQKLILKLVNSL